MLRCTKDYIECSVRDAERIKVQVYGDERRIQISQLREKQGRLKEIKIKNTLHFL